MNLIELIKEPPQVMGIAYKGRLQSQLLPAACCFYSILMNTWGRQQLEVHSIVGKSSGKAQQTTQCPREMIQERRPQTAFTALFFPLGPGVIAFERGRDAEEAEQAGVEFAQI